MMTDRLLKALALYHIEWPCPTKSIQYVDFITISGDKKYLYLNSL